jgi:hypothetical protein
MRAEDVHLTKITVWGGGEWRANKVASVQLIPRDLLSNLLKPHLKYADDERDVAFVRTDAPDSRAGRRLG